ncbi:MAG: TusE/DsrC/DsvC family sulfur relay protein [Aestuariibacter sp.]
MTEQFYIQFENQHIPTDKQGYLLNMDDWHEQLVPVLAESENIALTDNHWEVIHFVRAFYQEYQTSPAIRMLVNAMKDKLGADKGNSRYLHRLFPKGAAKQATKLAGLPKPAKCL